MAPASKFSLRGRTAVVTGACGKLGPVWVDALHRAGARVAAIDLPGAAPPPALRGAIIRMPRKLRLLHGDACDREAMARVRDALSDWPQVSILVNNAGIDQPPSRAGARARFEDIATADFLKVLGTNVLSAMVLCQVFAADLKATRGAVINIGSLYAHLAPDQRLYDHIEGRAPFTKPPAYGASKAAVVNLTKYLAALWAENGVRVNSISPGGVLGGQDPAFRRKYIAKVPMRRMTLPSDLGGPLVFLASEASSYVTGIDLRVDGGFSAW